MSDRVNQKWSIDHSRVYGRGYSFNLTSKVDAERLYHTLNNYEEKITTTEHNHTKLQKIEKQIHTVQKTLNEVKELLK